eukprot:7827548-Heterocapsa_arctica.AAC.1
MAVSGLAIFLKAVAAADEQTGEAIRQVIGRTSGCWVPVQGSEVKPVTRSRGSWQRTTSS